MKNKLAKTNFILLTVIVLFALVMCVISFNLPFSTNKFNGFARAFNLGVDFGGGSSAVYTIDTDNFYNNNNVSGDTVRIVQDLINDKYGDGSAEIVDDNKVKVTVPDTTISSEILLASLEIKAEEGKDAETYITGKHIKKVEYRMNGTTHGVYITFNKEGKQKFADLTGKASSNSSPIVIYLNRNYDQPQTINIDEQITTGYAFLSSASKSSAKTFVQQLNNTRHGLNMTLEGKVSTIHATYQTWHKVIFAVVACSLIVASFAYLIVRFKQFGLVSSLALMMFAVASVMLFALVPQVRLTLSSYVGMLFSYILAFAMNLVLLENCRKEFASGKKLPASLKTGYRKSVMPIVDTLVLVVAMCLVSFIFGDVALVGFSTPLILATLVNAAVNLGIMRWFIFMYLSINPGKGAMLNFTREEGVNEIK